MIIPAQVPMTIPAQVLMKIQNQSKLVTCNYKLSAINTMLIMIIIHCVKRFTDQHTYHTMKTARNCCCRKLQMSCKDNLKLLYHSLPEGMCDNEYESLEQGIIDFETFQYSHETGTKCTSSGGLCRLSLPSYS